MTSTPKARGASHGDGGAGRVPMAMLEAISLPAWFAGPDGVRAHHNAAWLQRVGCAGEAWREAVQPEHLERVESAPVTGATEAAPVVTQYALRFADGGYRQVEETVKPVRWPDGSVAGYLGMVVEDPGWAKAKVESLNAELKHRVEELEVLFEVLPVAVGVTNDREAADIRTNPAFARMLGVSTEENISSSTRAEELPFVVLNVKGERIPPENLPLQLAAREGVTTAGLETVVEFANGKRRYLLESAVPLLDSEGQTRGAVGAFADVTELAEAEERIEKLNVGLKRAQRRMKEMTNAVRSVLFVMSSEGVLLTINEFGARALGFWGQSIYRHRLADVMAPETVDELRVVWRAGVAKGEPFDTEVLVRMADGGYRWHTVRMTPLPDGDGTVRRWLGVGMDIHDRKLVEQRLVESEEEYRSLADGMPELMLRVDLEGRIDYANAAGLAYSGRSRGDLYGMPWWKVLAAEDVRELNAAWSPQQVGEDALTTREVRLRRHDGEFRWHQVRRVPVHGVDGSLQHWVMTATDINDRVEAERLVAESEARYRQLANSLPMVMLMMDPGGRITFVNDYGLQFTGFAREGFDGPVWGRTVLPESAMEIMLEGRKIRASGMEGTLDHQLRRADGEYRWFTWRHSPVRNAAGEILQWVGTGIDIHDRKMAEERLAESEERYRGLAESIPAVVMSTDLHGHIEWMNAAGVEYLGMPLEEVRRTSWLSLIPPDDVERAKREVGAIGASKMVGSFEGGFRRADGQFRWFRWNNFPVHDAEGKVVRWIEVGIDLQDRKEAEELVAASEARYRGLSAAMPAVVFTYDRQGNLTFVNDYGLEYVGHPLEALGTEVKWEEVMPEFGEISVAEVLEREAAGQPIEWEQQLRRADGELRWHQWRLVGVRDAEGHLVVWVGTGSDIHDRKVAEEKLAESEARYRQLANAMPALVTYTTLDGNWEWVNAAGLEYLGLKQEDVPTTPWYKTVRPEHLQRAMRQMREFAERGEPATFEVDVRRADGQYRFFRWSQVPVRDASGKVVRWINVGLDIEDRKRMEEALAESEARYRALTEAVPAIVTTTDLEGRYEWVNPAGLAYLGLTLEEVENVPWYTLLRPDQAADAKHTLIEAAKAEMPVTQESYLRRADGEYHWFRWHNVPMRDADGRVVRWVNVGMDLEDRKRAEEALAESEANFRELANSMPGIVTATGADGRIAWMNTKGLEYLGVAAAEAEGAHWLKWLRHADLNGRRAKMRRAAAEGLPVVVDSEVKGADGEYRWFNWTSTPLRDAHGNVVRWLNVGVDIHDRKRAEEEVAASEARYRGLTSALPSLIFTYDMGFHLTYINDYGLGYMGLTREEFEDVADIADWGGLVPDSRGWMTDEERHRAMKGEPVAWEAMLRRADGEMRWQLWRLVAVRDGEGRVVQWVGTATDNHDRKVAEVAVAASEQRYRTLANAMPAIVSSTDINHRHEWMNPAGLAFMGLPADAVPDDSWIDWWIKATGPEQFKRVQEGLKEAAKTGKAWSGELLMRRVDGEMRWLDWSFVPLRDAEGNLERWLNVGVDVHDRRMAEDALAEARDELERALGRQEEVNALLETLLQNAPIGFAFVDTDLRYLRVNPALREINGLPSPELMLERRVAEIAPNAPLPLLRVLETGEPMLDVSATLQRKDGTTSRVQSSFYPVRIGEEVVGVGVMAQDVTRDWEAAAALRTENALRRTITDTASAALFMTDTEGLIEFVNPAAERMIGLPYQAVVGRIAHEVVHFKRPDGSPYPAEECAVHLLAGQPVGEQVIEDVFTRADGSLFPVVVHSSPIISEGVHTGRLVEVRDVTAEKVAEAEAEAGRARLQLLADAGQQLGKAQAFRQSLEVAAELIVAEFADACSIDLVDGAGGIERAALRAAPFVPGWALQASIDAPPRMGNPNDVVSRVLESGEPEYFPVMTEGMTARQSRTETHGQFLSLLGKRSMVCVPLTAEGRTYGAITVRSRGVSPYTEEDYELVKELGRRIGSWLEKVRLIEELQRANAAKDEFMGMISHEMRTPLTIINGGARILSRTQMELTDEERAGLVGDMERESVRLLQMVDNLLAMARVELSEEIEREPVIVERVVRRAIAALEERGSVHEFRVEVAEDVPLVEAHESSLDQVLRNLLTNAQKYSPATKPVTISVAYVEGMVEVVVRDEGPGIPEDDLGRLFEPFYRSAKTSLQVPGTGLGMPLCKRLVESMHGTIRAGNRAGGGFEVVFTLPVLADEPLE